MAYLKKSNFLFVIMLLATLSLTYMTTTSNKAYSQTYLITNQHQNVSSIKQACLSKIDTNVKDVVNRIEKGGPFYYHQDGTHFHNFQGLLPALKHRDDIYLEYTVGPPHMLNRGAERVIVDSEHMNWYFTNNHYNSFMEIVRC